MSHLPAAEAHRYLHTVAVGEELLSVAELRVEVVGVDTGRHTDLLDLDDTLIFLGFLFLLRLLETELTIVHDLTHGGIGAGSDLNKIKLVFLGYLQRRRCGHDAELLALTADQAYFFIKDLFVDLMSCVCDCDSPPRKIKTRTHSIRE